jgi:uncharacterized LabA/DUF88 family protein
VTTQDTHQEYDNVDASVVEHPSTPEHETTVNSTASEMTMLAETPGEQGNLSPESILPGGDEPQAHEDAPAPSEAGASIVLPEILVEAPEASFVTHTTASEDVTEVQEAPSSSETTEATSSAAEIDLTTAVASVVEASSTEEPFHASETESQVYEAHSDEVSTDQLSGEQPVADFSATPSDVLSVVEPIAESGTIAAEDANIHYKEEPVSAVSEEPSITFSVEVSPLVDSKVEEVRPFTDFIAEFRQAEAALRDSQVEALSILSSGTADLTFVEPQAEESTVFGEVKSSEAVVAAGKEDGVQVKIDEINGSGSSEQGAEAEAPMSVEKSPAQPVIRPVSPLLRPASRLRIPRHGVTRHQREEAPVENQVPVEAPVETQPAKVEPQLPVVAEPIVEPTPPRPARRYRFDRPAALNNGSTNGSAPAPATVDSTASSVVNGAAPHPEETNAAAKSEAALPVIEQTVELQTAKPLVQETEMPALAATIDHTRRRHNTHKEQPVAPLPAQTAQPVVEPVVQVPEPSVQPAEIAPEDLPPLEYSELQKASSRRRRRHRSGSTTVPSVPVIPTSVPGSVSSKPVEPIIAPVIAPPPLPVVPTPPPARIAASEPSQSSYTIVSGYTVNQMNQGNDLSGPFMAPDPSPARGSVVTRDGRAVRAETRTAQPTAPVYPPSRPMDNGLSTAAMTQFANIVSQALQTQTDRMVSEFRRIGQSPTNVSVTLPPFPSTERVGVFVDVANLLYSARTLRIGVDFGKLLDFLRGNRRLVRAHAYCPTSPQPGDEQMFLQAVKGLGYRITTKNYKTFSSGAKKADLDLDLCMDVVRLVDGGAVDCVVLVSGDSDFMPMLDYCSDHGVRVEVAAFDEAMSATLRQSCDLFINLSMLDEIRA